ncbi:uncharacterized protein LOC111679216 [Lucilia cuprina]|uniref:uncharacterized protein LOC111679216 n=1 Tax=Lucilia cuprina TaxID=7375 RepID=UPI001F07020B|nr:uncharacterized protein LOC111679216 [Lucilia cuprina]
MALLLNLRYSLPKVLKITNTNSLGQRSISTTPSLLWLNQKLARSSNEKEKRYLEKDRVPQNYQLIYRAPMESYVAWSMHVSTITASIIGTAAIYQYASNQPILEPLDTTLAMSSEDIYYFAFGFMAINAVMRFVVSMFPLRIYKDQEKYLAIYHSQLPMNIKQHQFKKGQVTAVYYNFSPWNNATYKLGNKTSLLLEDYFKTPSEFHQMSENEEKFKQN